MGKQMEEEKQTKKSPTSPGEVQGGQYMGGVSSFLMHLAC